MDFIKGHKRGFTIIFFQEMMKVGDFVTQKPKQLEETIEDRRSEDIS